MRPTKTDATQYLFSGARLPADMLWTIHCVRLNLRLNWGICISECWKMDSVARWRTCWCIFITLQQVTDSLGYLVWTQDSTSVICVWTLQSDVASLYKCKNIVQNYFIAFLSITPWNVWWSDIIPPHIRNLCTKVSER
jgi:hypothetical protein